MNSLNGVMVVGLTGQTGAGKSTVSRLFAESGFFIAEWGTQPKSFGKAGISKQKEFGINEFHHVSLHYGGDSAADSSSFEDGSEIDFAGCSNAV